MNINDFIIYIEDKYPHLKVSTARKIEGSWQLIGVRGDEPVSKFDAILVPMLGFDSTLHRIGFGGGYYDRFLAGQKQAIKIGICFELGKTAEIPTEPHDIPLDIIISELQIYQR